MKFPKNIIYSKPKNSQELYDRVLIYGAFLDGIQYVKHYLHDTNLGATTIIIRGPVGCGKKTLMRKIEELYLKKSTTTLYLDPYLFSDDVLALKYVNCKLGLDSKQSQYDVCQSIKGYKRKAVIVLNNFEIFCRNKQNLLYCLTDFTRDGIDINLIGLTTSTDCTELVEKRVRSRLNPIFYDLSPPYRNLKEYIEFASILLGNHKIQGMMLNQLECRYLSGDKSIRSLKRYLKELCLWNENGLTVHKPAPTEKAWSSGHSEYLKNVLGYLTKQQLELLVIVVCCYENQEEKREMTLLDLQDFTRKRNSDRFDFNSPLIYRDIKFLTTIGLLKPVKFISDFTHLSKFDLGITAKELKIELESSGLDYSDTIWRLGR